MLDLKQNIRALVGFGVAAILIWWMLAYGFSEPFSAGELEGLSQQEVRKQCGEPDDAWKDEAGNDVWHYQNGVLPMGASSDVVFKNGVVARVFGHTPNK